MKLHLFAITMILLIFFSCSENKDKGKQKNNSENVVFIQNINYKILRQWKPNSSSNGFGAEILLLDKLDKNEVIKFVKGISGSKDPVKINIYTSQEAYNAENNQSYGEEYSKGFLLVYIKNGTNKGAYKGVNEIRWMQETGSFSDLFGSKTKIY